MRINWSIKRSGAIWGWSVRVDEVVLHGRSLRRRAAMKQIAQGLQIIESMLTIQMIVSEHGEPGIDVKPLRSGGYL